MNNKIYQEITDKIIAQLTKGIIPWEQPWFGVLGARSFNTNEAYSFLNQLVLGGENGHFITWHQLNMLKGHLRKGSKARRVFFWSTFEKAEETDKGEKVIKKIPYLKTYTVFNANDCDGLPQRWASEKNNKPIESAEKITKDYLDREKIELKKNRSEAYYNVKDDFIALPDLANFKSSQGYYGTLLHEIIHSTGSQKRLGRFKANDTSSPFGSPNYSREELVAEIGSSFLLHHLGISNSKTLEQNVAYIQNWIQALNNDVSLIAIAAGRAEKAVQFVLGENK